jgi:hypothetical protein
MGIVGFTVARTGFSNGDYLDIPQSTVPCGHRVMRVKWVKGIPSSRSHFSESNETPFDQYDQCDPFDPHDSCDPYGQLDLVTND